MVKVVFILKRLATLTAPAYNLLEDLLRPVQRFVTTLAKPIHLINNTPFTLLTTASRNVSDLVAEAESDLAFEHPRGSANVVSKDGANLASWSSMLGDADRERQMMLFLMSRLQPILILAVGAAQHWPCDFQLTSMKTFHSTAPAFKGIHIYVFLLSMHTMASGNWFS
ncbi:unnamed protein product [Protopolystoma xenopodis]|uniref:Uncharacterized protein n=1 Tax=Protopolystoma xenopodis TaxID=117903 RepID=A0A3S5BW37_9PLAT|nr:unnamed protein product [Protopolystoma xenopodis]